MLHPAAGRPSFCFRYVVLHTVRVAQLVVVRVRNRYDENSTTKEECGALIMVIVCGTTKK